MEHDMNSMGSGFDFHFLSMVTVRGFWLLPLILMTGIVGFRLFVFNPAAGSLGEKSREKEIRLRIGLFSRRWISVLFLLFTFMSVAALFHETLMISGKNIRAVFPYLVIVLEKTHWGRIWVDRFIVSTVLGLIWASCLNRENIPFRMVLILLIALSGTFSLIGHPADTGDFTWRVIMDTLHLAAVSLWIGGLVPLFYLIAVIRPGYLPEMNPFLTKIVGRFSVMATLCVVLILATGLSAVWNTWGRFPTMGILFSSNYGKYFLTKLVFVLFVLMTGAASRFYILPGLRKVPSGIRSPLVNRFYIFLMMELIFTIGILISAFLLTQSTPPSVHRHQNQEYQGKTGLPFSFKGKTIG
ncbi:MAG: copper resistance D family protein [Nitrospiria bacterium]